MKLIGIVDGMQMATSAYPSPYCHFKLRTLRGQELADDNFEAINNEENKELNNAE